VVAGAVGADRGFRGARCRPIDEEIASRRLGYQLGRDHIALRIAGTGSEIRGLERAVDEAAAAVGAGQPLIVASGAARFDVWCGSFGAPATDGLEGYGPPPGVLVAFGTPGHGLAGFRSSHAEALQAARIGSLAGGATVTSYVHQNTVTYRVKRAEEMLGRKVSERPIELMCALTLAAHLGPAVVAAEGGMHHG
jgi:hypothetical protein